MSNAIQNSVVRQIDLTDGEVDFYNEYGYLYIPEFVDRSVTDALRDEVLQVMESKGFDREQLNKATGTADKLRQISDYLKGSRLDSLINSQQTLDIASRLIGGQAVRYLPFTAVKAGGGGGEFHFHQDNNYTRHDPATGSINIWVALVDMTPENGCLRMVPGSHKLGTVESVNAGDGDGHRKVQDDPEKALPLRMRAGDAVAFTRVTIHGSGPNHTDQVRVAYGLQYHRDDVKFLDRESDEWRRLVDVPKFQTPPLDSFG